MLFIGTKLKIVDNSGAKIAKCLTNYSKKYKKTVGIGDLILVSLKKIRNRKKIVKRLVYVGLIVGVKYWVVRKDGTRIRFFNNRVLIFSKQFKFLGSRIYGLILKETKIKILKRKKYRTFFKKIIAYKAFTV